MQGQWQGIGLQQFGLIKAGATLLFGWAPQADAATGAQAARPPSPLLGAGQAGWHGDQAIHAAVGIEAGAAAETAVDHQGYPFDGERALGDRGGQHNLALRALGWGDGLALGCQGQVAVEGHPLDRRPPVAGRDGPFAGLDLPQTRQKHQHRFVACAVVKPVLLQGPQYLPLQPLVRAGALVLNRHRVAPAFTLKHPRLRQLGG